MSELDTIIPTIRENQNDPQWMDKHSDALYDQIQRHLRPHTIQQAFTALTLVAQHFWYESNSERWIYLFEDALLPLMNARDNARQHEAYYQMGHFHLVGRRPNAAVTAFQKAGELAQQDQERVEAYIALLKAMALQSAGITNEPAYDFLLRYARDCKTLYTRGLIYEAAAQYHTSRERPEMAYAYAQIAYSVWRQAMKQRPEPTQEDHRHIGSALFIMGVAARLLGSYALAQRYLDLATTFLDKLPYKQNVVMVSYEHGVLHAMHGRHREALANFQRTYDFFAAQNNERHTFAAFAAYGAGLNLVKLGRYKEAEDMLLSAHETWRGTQHLPNKTRAEHALGYLYLQVKDEGMAGFWLGKAQATVSQIPDEHIRQLLLQRMQKNLEDLSNLRGKPGQQ